jgi:hypothetical protein
VRFYNSTPLIDARIYTILKIKNTISRLFSKSVLSEEEEKDLSIIALWIILKVSYPPELSQEDEVILKQSK